MDHLIFGGKTGRQPKSQHILLVGGFFATPLNNDGVGQLG